MKSKEDFEEELEIYKERLEGAMKEGNLAWWEMELPSGKVNFNDRKAGMLGYSPERFEHYTDFTGLIHPDDYDRAMKAMRDHLEGKADRYEVEYRIQKENGEFKWFRDVGGITEEGDDYKKVTGIVIDIDDRKKAEEREDFLHSLLRHDVRNKNQVVQSYLELLEDFDLPEEAMEYIKKSKDGIREGMDIIEKVRTLRKADEEETKDVDISAMIRDGVGIWESQAEERSMKIITECSSECEVKGGSLLDRVFSNIVENSIQHSGGSKIKISENTEDGEFVCIIEDDGKGIPEEDKEKIFKRGYTTDAERGSGIGMFLVKMLLESYGGRIEVKDSELGGARFDIYLKKV